MNRKSKRRWVKLRFRLVGERGEGSYKLAVWEVAEKGGRGYFAVCRRGRRMGVSGDLGEEEVALRFFRLAAALEVDPVHLSEAARDFRLGEEFGPGQVLLREGAELGRAEAGHIKAGNMGDVA
jgi:hypothetical protein